MLVEIPDPEVILAIIGAFLGGLFLLYFSYKIWPLMKRKDRNDPSYLERLEFYERQLIDMKIRMDSMDVGEFGTKTIDLDEPRRQMVEKSIPREVGRLGQKSNIRSKPRSVNLGYSNIVDFVLELITEKPMTSRDIQITSQRSREHTSRLMNKLFKEGYVERNTKTKPYSYYITDKGRAKLGSVKLLQNSVA